MDDVSQKAQVFSQISKGVDEMKALSVAIS